MTRYERGQLHQPTASPSVPVARRNRVPPRGVDRGSRCQGRRRAQGRRANALDAYCVQSQQEGGARGKDRSADRPGGKGGDQAAPFQVLCRPARRTTRCSSGDARASARPPIAEGSGRRPHRQQRSAGRAAQRKTVFALDMGTLLAGKPATAVTSRRRPQAGHSRSSRPIRGAILFHRRDSHP